MKVLIVGVGRVGSALAFAMLHRYKKKLKILGLSDINLEKEYGEILDLQEAAALLNLDVEIKHGCRQEVYDFMVICAGRARDLGETDDELFNSNRRAVDRSIVKFFANNVLIATNPPGRLTKHAELTITKAYPIGGELDNKRIDIGHSGASPILKAKGYTVWGVVVEICNQIDRILNGRV